MAGTQPPARGHKMDCKDKGCGAGLDLGLGAMPEVARALGLSTRTVRRLWQTGKLPAPIRLGGSLRWDMAALREWLAKGAPAMPNRKGPYA